MRTTLKALFILLLLSAIGCATNMHTDPMAQDLNLSEYPSFSNAPVIIRQPEEILDDAVSYAEIGPLEYTEEELANIPTVSNLWEDTDLRSVLQDMTAQTGVNIIYDDTVDGEVTAELDEVALDEALEMVLQPWGYTFKKVDGYYLVGMATPGQPFALSLSQTEIVITNRKAEEVIELLSSDLTPFLKAVDGGYSISITAPPKIIQRFRKDLELVDPTQPLIVIEVLVTEIKQNHGNTTGIDWSQILDFSASGNIDIARGADMVYTGVLKSNLASSVKILAQQGSLNLRACPKLVTQNGKEAEITVGKEQYIILYESRPSSSSYWYSPFEAKPINSGVTLKVTPQLSRNGDIVLILNIEVSDTSQTPENANFPTVEKRSVKTTLRVEPGKTVVFGGLYQELSREVETGIPVLRRIPLLGYLFRQKTTESEKTELIIFVTPKVLIP